MCKCNSEFEMAECARCKEGGPAFPNSLMDNEVMNGMNMRAYIATSVLNGLISGNIQFRLGKDETMIKSRASWAVAHADALLAALKA